MGKINVCENILVSFHRIESLKVIVNHTQVMIDIFCSTNTQSYSTLLELGCKIIDKKQF